MHLFQLHKDISVGLGNQVFTDFMGLVPFTNVGAKILSMYPVGSHKAYFRTYCTWHLEFRVIDKKGTRKISTSYTVLKPSGV